MTTNRSDLDRKLLAAVERLSRAMRFARQQLATTHGLSVLQIQLVELLFDKPGSRVGDLAKFLDVTQPTVSDALASLQGKTLVSRERDPDDGRASILLLTDQGAALASGLAEQLAALVDGAHPASGDDRGVALEVLLKTIKQMQANGLITINRSCPSCQHYQPPVGAVSAQCLLLDEALLPKDLRVDCEDHVGR